jgi:hypothetical protein
MNEVVSPGSADEALDMLRSAIRYLAAADATAMTAEEQARCLGVLEQVNSAGTAARTSVLSAFASAQGHGADAEYSPRAWLIHKTGVTRGAAMACTAWVRRAEDHPRVFAAMAAEELSESVARILCQWTNRLPEDCRDLADDKLVAAAAAGMSLRDLAELFGEIYEQSRSGSPDQDTGETFDDRAVRLITTFQGAGVLSGDLTPECAEAVAAVLDALSAPAASPEPNAGQRGGVQHAAPFGTRFRRPPSHGHRPAEPDRSRVPTTGTPRRVNDTCPSGTVVLTTDIRGSIYRRHESAPRAGRRVCDPSRRV